MLEESASNSVATQLLEAARKLRPVLAERAEKTDRDRRLPDETIADLTEAGLFRVTGHKRRDGHGLTAEQSIEITAELAKGCTSSAFVQALLDGSRGVVVAKLDDEGVDEVFATSDDPLITGILAPGGMAVPADGGFVVNGSWSYATGCWHAHWAMGGVMVADAQGNVVDGGTIYAPMSELTIEDTWHVAGMRGTGSATIVAKDVFVPKRRISLQSEMGAKFEQMDFSKAEPVDLRPFAEVFALVLLGPVLGAAEAALELVAGSVGRRGISYFTFEKQSDSHVVLEQIAEAAMRIDTAWLHTRRAAGVVEAATMTGPLDAKTGTRCRADAGYAMAQVRQAVDTLMNVAGTSAFAESNALQRIWRDVNVASRHGYLATKPNLELYGRAYCGVEPSISMF